MTKKPTVYTCWKHVIPLNFEANKNHYSQIIACPKCGSTSNITNALEYNTYSKKE